MIPSDLNPNVQQQLTPSQITDLLDRNMQWIDQYNHHLNLTVQALQRLHVAFDGKFTGGPPNE